MSPKTASKRKEKHSTRFYVSIVLLTTILLALPLIIRGNLDLTGTEPFYHQRIAELIIQGKTLDPLSFSGREITSPIGTPAVLAGLLILFKSSNVLIFLPIILGLITILLLHKTLIQLGVSKKHCLITLIILLLSPPFIHTFTQVTTNTIPIVISLLAFYTFLRRNPLTIFFLGLLPFFGLLPFIITSLLIYFYSRSTRQQKRFLKSIWLSIIMAIWEFIPLIFKHGFPTIQKQNYLQIITNIESHSSLNIFLLFLVAFGISTLWKKKYYYWTIYLSMITMMLTIPITINIIPYLIIFLSPVAALGLLKLIQGNWESPLIKYTIVIILMVGVVFATTIFYQQSIELGPSSSLIDSLNFIKEESKENSLILSHIKNGIWINSIAQRKNFFDDQLIYAPKLDERLKEGSILFETRDEDTALHLLKKYGIDYILITPEMKHGLTWSREEQGLLFLLKYSKSFKLQYQKNNIEIWKVIL